ncbi:NAD(P)/FAD-dependent oxidoreductase [Virgibacillus salexigens]|uniref:Hydrogen cyanide synthase subunit HcnC n=1 Tax=Virgibacillus massiliensis TaxID=1462526 RepID=A0A024QFX5_9BACI|nr:FAD-dependent oxidoreductase [Virgibacillus massiliensis]CDQ40861.1 Hydrogen cyanide synthase subunit HcnC precursor [Virgibacillus massiliensis]
MKKKIIVVGGGIAGASAAYYLAKANHEVTIIDRSDNGQATDAAAGIVCPWLSQRRNKAWYQLVKAGARIYPSLVDALAKDGEGDIGYDQVGALHLHKDEQKLIAMKERAEKRKIDAPEIGHIEILDPEQTKRKFRLLDNNYSSVYVSGAARVNGQKLRDALLNGAQKHGAVFINGSAELNVAGHKVIGAIVDNQKLPADSVIAATGAWMPELLKPLGIKFQVEAQRAQILHVAHPYEETATWPVVKPPNNQYMLSFPDNRIVLGATHEHNVGFDPRITAGGLHEILSKAMEYAPGISDSTIVEARVGFRPVTPNFLPVIGPIPKFKGLYLTNGLGSTGLTMGPYIGSQLAKMATDQEHEIDLDNYDINGAIY